jgi:hypothetical protein
MLRSGVLRFTRVSAQTSNTLKMHFTMHSDIKSSEKSSTILPITCTRSKYEHTSKRRKKTTHRSKKHTRRKSKTTQYTIMLYSHARHDPP